MSKSDDELIALHLEAQDALRRFGVTPYALRCQRDLERAVVVACELDPLNGEQLDIALGLLHREAYPDAKARPTRLTTGDMVDPREG